MKRHLIQLAIQDLYQSLNERDLKELLDMDMDMQEEAHVNEMMIIFIDEVKVNQMTEEEIDALWMSLPL